MIKIPKDTDWILVLWVSLVIFITIGTFILAFRSIKQKTEDYYMSGMHYKMIIKNDEFQVINVTLDSMAVNTFKKYKNGNN